MHIVGRISNSSRESKCAQSQLRNTTEQMESCFRIAAGYGAVKSVTHQSTYYLELFLINFHCGMTSQSHWGKDIHSAV